MLKDEQLRLLRAYENNKKRNGTETIKKAKWIGFRSISTLAAAIVGVVGLVGSLLTVYLSIYGAVDDLRVVLADHIKVVPYKNGVALQGVESPIFMNIGNRPAAIVSMALTLRRWPDSSGSGSCKEKGPNTISVQLDAKPIVIKAGEIESVSVSAKESDSVQKNADGLRYLPSFAFPDEKTGVIDTCLDIAYVTPDDTIRHWQHDALQMMELNDHKTLIVVQIGDFLAKNALIIWRNRESIFGNLD